MKGRTELHTPRQIALNYTCRFCRPCDLLIGQKHEIEHLLTELFRRSDPTVIGNAYLIFGTVEKRVWREGVAQPKGIAELLPQGVIKSEGRAQGACCSRVAQ